MKTSKLTIAMLFAASMAWANVAAAEEPCGAPVETFESCEIVQAPNCDDACTAEALVGACVAQNADPCMSECTGPDSISCASTCEQQCGDTCTVEFVKGGGVQDCAVSCGASCMSDCGAGCEVSGDKTTCFAACNQQCDAHCDLSCKATPDVHDNELDVDEPLDDAQEFVKGGGTQDCVVSCGASCMGDCAAGCEVSDDKTACFASCNQECDAHCEVSCDGQADVHDNDLELTFDDYQEGNWWDDQYEKCKKKYKHNWKKKCKKKNDWKDDWYKKCKKKYKHNWKKYCKKWHDEQAPGLEVDSGHAAQDSSLVGADQLTRECQLSCQQSCTGVCEAGNARVCELDCQVERTTVCAPQMASSCSDDCNRGAVLLCDGRYLDVGDVDACVAALEHGGIVVQAAVIASGSGDGEIVVDALQGASCSIEEPDQRWLVGGLLGLVGLGLGAGFVRRRRRG